MKKIKIKVKHLIYIALTLILIRFLIIPQGIYLAAKISEKKDIEVSKVLYKRYSELAVGKEEKAKALYNLAESIVPNFEGEKYREKIFPTMSTVGSSISAEMIDNACKNYNDIIERYKDTSYYSKAYGRIINLYMIKGNHKEAERIIEEGIKSSNKEIRILSTKYRIVYLMAERKYEEGISLGEDLIKNGSGDNDVYMLLGDIRFYSGKYEEAKVMYGRVETLYNSKQKAEDKNFYYYNGEADRYSRVGVIDRVLFNSEGRNTLFGQVKINGQSIPLALVYVKEIQDNENGSFTGIEKDCIMAVTDLNGNYRIEGIKDGKYELGVDVATVCLYNTTYQAPKEEAVILKSGERKEYNFTFVPPIKVLNSKGIIYPKDNKIFLQWEKVEGAAYYRINTIDFENPEKMEGNSCSGPIMEEIYDTKTTLDILKANNIPRGFFTDDSNVPNFQSYFGSFYPGCKTPIYITAYDADNRCIGSSKAIKMESKNMIIISVSEKDLTEADRLILKSQPEKALKLYEEALKKNPKDIHAMDVLSRIYSIGTKVIYGDFPQNEKRENQNVERAFQLRKNLYNITGNSEYIKSLPRLIEGSKEVQKQILEELKKLPDEELNSEQYSFMARISLKYEDLDNADVYFDKARDKSKSYIDMNSVILKLYLNDNVSAIARAEEMNNLFLYKINKEEFIESINKLSNVNKSSEDYNRFKEAIRLILLKNDGYIEAYKNVSNSIQDKDLKDFINIMNLWYGIR